MQRSDSVPRRRASRPQALQARMHVLARHRGGADDEHLDMMPTTTREQRRKDIQERDNVSGEDQHTATSFQKWLLTYPPSHLSVHWTKSGLLDERSNGLSHALDLSCIEPTSFVVSRCEKVLA